MRSPGFYEAVEVVFAHAPASAVRPGAADVDRAQIASGNQVQHCPLVDFEERRHIRHSQEGGVQPSGCRVNPDQAAHVSGSLVC